MRIKRKPLDDLFSKYIRLKAENRCERCGNYSKKLDCSHFWGRGRLNVRHDEENASALCCGCHKYLGSNAEEHRAFFLKRLGQERYDLLQIRANTRWDGDEEALKLYFRKKISELKEGEE